MIAEITLIVFLILAALAAVMISNSLRTLAAMREQQIQVHDLARQSKRMRSAYQEALKKRSSDCGKIEVG